ncbi:MAG: heavy metal-binding domain-containing protein [Syntrophales bacterium]|nr:heavy metal-binding domain-containing protein [Syntrophales bacterium]
MHSEETAGSAELQDPVCGMSVAADSPLRLTHNGKVYGFCSPHCLEKFQQDPEQYAAPGAAGESAATGRYACPMHPEIIQEKPGDCPLCGMALEPLAAPAPEAEKPEAPQGDYTCPMHPEVRQPGPGACPKCGMALEPVAPPAPGRTEWTCPMHPEIVRDEPGNCPICGMALEPRQVSAAEEENPE